MFGCSQACQAVPWMQSWCLHHLRVARVRFWQQALCDDLLCCQRMLASRQVGQDPELVTTDKGKGCSDSKVPVKQLLIGARQVTNTQSDVVKQLLIGARQVTHTQSDVASLKNHCTCIACQVARLQSLHHSVPISDGPPGAVDDEASLLHAPDGVFVEHALGAVGQGHLDHDHIAASAQLCQLWQANPVRVQGSTGQQQCGVICVSKALVVPNRGRGLATAWLQPQSSASHLCKRMTATRRRVKPASPGFQQLVELHEAASSRALSAAWHGWAALGMLDASTPQVATCRIRPAKGLTTSI